MNRKEKILTRIDVLYTNNDQSVPSFSRLANIKAHNETLKTLIFLPQNLNEPIWIHRV